MAGATIVSLSNPQLTAEVGVAAATLATARARLRRAEVDDRARVEALRGEVQSRSAKLTEAERRVIALQVRANVAGRWLPKAETDLLGRYCKRGEVLGYVVGGPSAIVRAAVPQEDMDLIRSRLSRTAVSGIPTVMKSRGDEEGYISTSTSIK